MLNAQQTIGVTTDNLKIERNGEYIVVDMNMGLSPLDVESNRAVLLTPRFVCATDTLELPSVGVYGRRRYYYYVRNGESMLSGKKEMTFKAHSRPEDVAYHAIIPYYKWMNGSALELYRSDYGCCSTLLAECIEPLGGYAALSLIHISESTVALCIPTGRNSQKSFAFRFGFYRFPGRQDGYISRISSEYFRVG